jgi:hypothetical protein
MFPRSSTRPRIALRSATTLPIFCRPRGLGNSLDDQLRLFGSYVRTCIERYPGDVSPRMREALDEALANRIAYVDEDNWEPQSRVLPLLSAQARAEGGF